LKDGSNSHTWAGDILAHAGYLEDAERAYAKSRGGSADPSYNILWRGWIVYGQRERAEKFIESAVTADKKAGYLASFADLLWRLGESDQARARYEAARGAASKIVDPAKRKALLATIDQGLQFVSEPPPYIISANPHPNPRFSLQESSIPAFPITTDGFQDFPPEEKAARARADEEMIRQLYARAAAGDLAGIKRITESAPTPFQRAIAIASLEHVLIQQHQPDLAEQQAGTIPEIDSACLLAKAEALSSAATEWLHKLDEDHAKVDFDRAKKLVFSVDDLLFGRISVLSSIAETQSRSGMMDAGATTFQSAIGLALKLPTGPQYAQGVRRPPTRGVHYRDEAFGRILRAAIRSHNLNVVDGAATAWAKSGDQVGSAVVDAWLVEGRTEEAIAAARRIQDPDQRVSNLLGLARTILSEQGAPNF